MNGGTMWNSTIKSNITAPLIVKKVDELITPDKYNSLFCYIYKYL